MVHSAERQAQEGDGARGRQGDAERLDGRGVLMANIRHFRELEVYRLARESAMRICEASKSFPSGEKYSLTDQIRRSSRSVCTNIAEGWRKRRYPNAFVSKLTDADAEGAETQVWLEFAFRCGYLEQGFAQELDEAYDHILGQLVNMLTRPEHWSIR